MVASWAPATPRVTSSTAMVPFDPVVCSRRVAGASWIEPGVTVWAPDLSLLATAPNTSSPAATAGVAPLLTAVATPWLQARPFTWLGRDNSKYSAIAPRVGPDLPDTVTAVAPGAALSLYQ